tara:strand:+ start:3031 stop:3177 length:147 start_codon:yes stop_codon:yes gene_type:complete
VCVCGARGLAKHPCELRDAEELGGVARRMRIRFSEQIKILQGRDVGDV